MKWSQALKIYNAGRGMYCMPRRGTPEHAAVLKIMGKEPKGEKKGEAPAAPAAAPVSHKMETPVVAMTPAERGMKASEAREAARPAAPKEEAPAPAPKKAAPKKSARERYLAKRAVVREKYDRLHAEFLKVKDIFGSEKAYLLANKLIALDKEKAHKDARIMGVRGEYSLNHPAKSAGGKNTGLMGYHPPAAPAMSFHS